MAEKPSSKEEEYFFKLEAQRLAERRQGAKKQRETEEKEARRRAHYMRCPKCGGELREQSFQDVAVDRCMDCGGIWFDAGEAEGLLDRDPGVLRRLFGEMLKGRGRGTPRA